MHSKYVCAMCDREFKNGRALSARGWCAACEQEFETAIGVIKCVRGTCKSIVTCVREKKCTQVRAALKLVDDMQQFGTEGEEH